MARDHNDTRRSGRVTVVVTEQTAQPLSALDLAFGATDFWSRFNDLVRQGLVIALMEQIGEGGMGVVFVAEQERPIRRKVALKVIKPGMDSKSVVARFEAERQALAMMDHPCSSQNH